jgi:hypothetical protein
MTIPFLVELFDSIEHVAVFRGFAMHRKARCRCCAATWRHFDIAKPMGCAVYRLAFAVGRNMR